MKKNRKKDSEKIHNDDIYKTCHAIFTANNVSKQWYVYKPKIWFDDTTIYDNNHKQNYLA